jgi:hypothetical protein
MPLSGKEFIDEIQEMVQRKHSEERTPNMLNALIKWVEEGQEPESILASRSLAISGRFLAAVVYVSASSQVFR